MKTRVCTIVGTRPELIKLACVIEAFDTAFDHILVHTGQNYDYELNQVFFEQLQIRKPDHYMGLSGSAAETIAGVIVEGDKLLREIDPAALLVLGDTNSCLVTIAAKKLKIPVFHMEAGNRCFDQRVPEEVNRKIVDHTSDINLPYTEHARRYLLNEGFPAERVIRTGSPMYEILTRFFQPISDCAILHELGLEAGDYFVVSAHREENVDNETRLDMLMQSLNTVAKTFDKPIIFSVHPRTRARLEEVGIEIDRRIRMSKPFGFFDYIKLQMHAACVLSDSGTVTEESSILGFPAITLRQAHERPEGMDQGVLIMSGLEPQNVTNSIKIAMSQLPKEPFQDVVTDYVAPNLSNQIVKLVASYTEYVNRTVWFGEGRGWN